MINKPLIYIIDDEPDICDLVSRELQQYGCETASFLTGKLAQAALKERLPALCIIDLGLPDMDGLSLVKALYDEQKIGVIILSGRNSLPDKVLGLELGADDYIGKPFDPRELVARVKSIIRRLDVTKVEPEPLKRAKFGDWIFEPSTLTLTYSDGESSMLSAAEAQTLTIFLMAPQKILTREQLLSTENNAYDRSIDVRMSRLRKKIEQDISAPKIIKTVYGAGYIFTLNVDWQ